MKVLIIEDNDSIANSIKKGLQIENIEAEIALNGEEGLNLATDEEFDVIILDLMLPKINGMDVCNLLRKKQNHTPIIILSAKSELETKVKALELGADDYLTKPFEFNELLARLKALNRRPKNQLTNNLICGNISLNTNTYEVYRGTKKVKLSKKEFMLLLYLIKNKNTVLSKEKIIENVWDFDSDILQNTVEQYINYLRKKLGKPNIIITTRGFGYKIID